jgi:hypothetical protein
MGASNKKDLVGEYQMIREKKRELSSSLTRIWKFYVPAFWSSIMGVGVLTIVARAGVEPLTGMFLIIWLVTSAVLFWIAFRLKQVSIDDRWLYVSNYRTEIQIPFSGIDKVTQTFLTNPKMVTIILSSPSAFGSKITFAPKVRFLDPLRSHPVVDELRSHIIHSGKANSGI